MSDPRVQEGIRLIRAQEWFESHEVLEDPWREAQGQTKSFLHALIHAAVAANLKPALSVATVAVVAIAIVAGFPCFHDSVATDGLGFSATQTQGEHEYKGEAGVDRGHHGTILPRRAGQVKTNPAAKT